MTSFRSSFVLAGVLGSVACGGATAPPEAPEKAAEPPRTAEARPVGASTGDEKRAKPADPPEREPESIVGLSFEPLVMGVRPGQTLLLAAHFRIAPGYRISWKATADVGEPTTVSFRAPPGFVVGDVEFPAPIRYTVTGGHTGYGYENETAVFAEVKVPGTFRASDVARFDLDASWVACKRICTTERTSAFVEIAYGSGRAKDVEQGVAPFLARVPKPLSAVPDAEAKWETGGTEAVLLLKLPGATPKDFFPDGTADPKPQKTELGDGRIRFVFDEAPRPGSRPLRGVVVATRDQKEEYIELVAPLPGEEEEREAEAAGKRAAKKRR